MHVTFNVTFKRCKDRLQCIGTGLTQRLASRENRRTWSLRVKLAARALPRQLDRVDTSRQVRQGRDRAVLGQHKSPFLRVEEIVFAQTGVFGDSDQSAGPDDAKRQER